MLKPVCNDKRCPGKTCKGEQQGKSFYATTGGAGGCTLAWRVYKAFRAGEKVALADLVEMGVRELDGRDPTTQVDVERDDLLKYTGRIGLCGYCTPRTEESRAKQAVITKSKPRGNLCTECGNRAIDGHGKKPPCAACAEKRAAKAAARST